MAARQAIPQTVDLSGMLREATRLRLMGALPEAELLYRRIRSAVPRHPVVLNDLGLLLAQMGKLRDSRKIFSELVAAHPEDVAGHLSLARVYRAEGMATKASYHFRQADRLAPADPTACIELIALHGTENQLDLARSAATGALARFPDSADVLTCLGVTLAKAGQYAEARPWLERAIALAPASAPALYNLAKVADEQNDLVAAFDLYQRAHAADPGYEPALFNLSEFHLRTGFVEEAIAALDLLLSRQPRDPATISLRCQAAQCQPGVTAAALLPLHRTWQRAIGDAIQPIRDHRKTFGPAARSPERLRIGLVSGDLREHPVGYFAIRAAECLDPATTEVFAYSQGSSADAIQQRFRQCVTQWRDTAAWSDARLAEEIVRDRVHVLIDLAGHTMPQRLLTFARRPAPVQLTWAGYVGTTGLDTMDGLIADANEVPEGEDSCYVEKIIRLPDDYICFDPPADAPEVGPLPALQSGRLTFGCFNNPAKVNAAIVALWARVLRAHPGSRMLFVYAGYDLPQVQQRIRAWFAAGGVDGGSLEFSGRVPRRDLLARYNLVDISLDTQPYSGGLTTLESLYMGVPVVTVSGQTFAARHARSHLCAAGFPELVAADADGFVATVDRLAADRERLAALRSGMRQQLLASPVCDGPRFARNLRETLQGLWDDWASSG